MDLLVTFLPLFVFGGLLLFLFRKSGSNTKEIIEANKRVTESNDRLAEAVQRLAEAIEKKQ
jgi:hypothetical protein